jgi:hypothetical protein
VQFIFFHSGKQYILLCLTYLWFHVSICLLAISLLYSLWSRVSCLFSLVPCLLYRLQSVVSSLLSLDFYSVFCLLYPVSCLLSLVFCLSSPVSCLLSLVSCLLSPKSCLLSLVYCVLSLVSCLLYSNSSLSLRRLISLTYNLRVCAKFVAQDKQMCPMSILLLLVGKAGHNRPDFLTNRQGNQRLRQSVVFM